MTFGENLQKARSAVNLTQEEVAEKIYVTRQTISRWETDRTLPNIYIIKDLSALYNKSIDELTLGIEVNHKKKLNLFAAFGVLAFNVFIGFWLIAAVLIILLSLAALCLALAASPFMMAYGIITNNQNVSFIQESGRNMLTIPNFFIALGLLAIAIVGSYFLWKLTKFLFSWLVNYLIYNLKSVYR